MMYMLFHRRYCHVMISGASSTAIPPSPVSVHCPDTIEELDSNLKYNITEESESTSMLIEESLTSFKDSNPAQAINVHADIDGKLCFISYQGAGTVQSDWYPVQVRTANADQVNHVEYTVDVFRVHPSDEKKKDNVSRYWPNWYEIKSVDREKISLTMVDQF